MTYKIKLDEISGYQICPSLAVNGYFKTKQYKKSTEMITVFEKFLGKYARSIRHRYSAPEFHINGEFEKEYTKQELDNMSYYNLTKWRRAWSSFIHKFQRELSGKMIVAHNVMFPMVIKDFEITYKIPVVYIEKGNPRDYSTWKITIVVMLRDVAFTNKSKLLNSPYFAYAWNYYKCLMQNRKGLPYIPVEMEFIHLGESAKSVVVNRGEYIHNRKVRMNKYLLHSLVARREEIVWPIVSAKCKNCPVRESCGLL